MEKTLLESELEKTLLELEMPLGERIYAEDLDFEAEIEDLMSEVKSTDPKLEKLVYVVSGGDLTEAQFERGHHNLFERRSELYKGLGFMYVIATEHKVGEKLPAVKIADKIISKRAFGKDGTESFEVMYNQYIGWQLENEKPRYRLQLTNKFYDNVDNWKFLLLVDSDYKIHIDSPAEEDSYEGCTNIRESLEKLEENFEGEYLNPENTKLLMDYVRELKNTV